MKLRKKKKKDEGMWMFYLERWKVIYFLLDVLCIYFWGYDILCSDVFKCSMKVGIRSFCSIIYWCDVGLLVYR